MASLRKTALKLFDIEEHETGKVFLLVLLSVFIGIFYATFDISATALFLDEFSESMISKAMLVSGAVGILMTMLYARLQNKINFSTLILLNISFITLITILIWLSFLFTSGKWIIFTVFFFLGPLNIIALTGFWGVAVRLFTLRQGKRLFGLIDSGQILGIIIISFAVPLLMIFLVETSHLLIISSVSIGAALVTQIIINRKFNLNEAREKEAAETETKETKLLSLFKNRYVRNISFFAVLSMVTAFFIWYSFLATAKQQYPEKENMTTFLALFFATVNIFILLFKTFVFSRIVKNYGINVSLMIMPVLLAVFTVFAVVVGSIFGYSPEMGNFIFFFLIIAMSRLFNLSLKSSIEVPSIKILYQSIEKKIRFRVQAAIDGVVNEFSALFAGLVLMILSFIDSFVLIHYSYALILIILGWIYITFRLFREYRLSLESSLARLKLEDLDVDRKDFFNNITKIPHPGVLIYCLRLIEPVFPAKFTMLLARTLTNKNPEVRKFSLERIHQHNYTALLPILEEVLRTEEHPEIKGIIISVIAEFRSQSKKTDIESIQGLINSGNPDDRIEAVKIISEFPQKEDLLKFEIMLLRDIEPSVRSAAVKAASGFPVPDICPVLIDYLDIPGLQKLAYEALVKIGDKAVLPLEHAYHKSGMHNQTLILIIKILGEIGGSQATGMLIAKLNSQKKEILQHTIEALIANDYKADGAAFRLIVQKIELYAGVTGWNLSALYTIKTEAPDSELENAMDDEIRSNYNLLFCLLSLAYDKTQVEHIRENLESEIGESISFALELLDLFISEELKPKLFPLLEDISTPERIKRLQEFYPVKRLEVKELLIAIINRDNNFISRYVKACAIHYMSKAEHKEISYDILAQVFNEDRLLKETAALLLFSNDKEIYEQCSSRLPPDEKTMLDYTFKYTGRDENDYLIEKLLFLRTCPYFSNLSGNVLVEIIQDISVHRCSHGNCDEQLKKQLANHLIIIRAGQVEMNDENGTRHYFEKGSLMDIPGQQVESAVFSCNDNVVCYLIQKSTIQDRIFRHKEICESLINAAAPYIQKT